MFFRDVFVYPRFPEGLKNLLTLSYNIWSLWDKDAAKLYYKIDSELFKSVGRNPIAFLHRLPFEKLKELEQNKIFLNELNKIWEKFNEYLNKEGGFNKVFPEKSIAYFSMEYGLHDSIPIFAGGLGILSGDHIKGSSDIKLPIIGVGLLYKYGYFAQKININGMQEEFYYENNPYYLPIKEVKNINGESIFIEIPMIDNKIYAKVWKILVGNNVIYLLDTNIEINNPEYRDITNYLYVADKEKRIQQEIVLGIGGYRLLKKLNLNIKIYHLNEGHSAFLLIEHLIDLMSNLNLNFEEAFILTKISSIFTTHTPVEAGNENFPLIMVKRYFDSYLLSKGIEPEKIYNLGLIGEDKNTFWLPALALRMCSMANGVSKIHGKVSRKMWSKSFPDMLENEVPINFVTNGVHYSWVSTDLTRLFDQYVGPSYIGNAKDENIWNQIDNISDEEIWNIHQKQKQKTITFIRKILVNEFINKGFSPLKVNSVSKYLNPNYLTIGFARRFAPYKRPSLLFKDKERLAKILKNSEYPVQIICAGKAHPADLMGKNLIKEIIDFTRQYNCEENVVFLENYSMNIAQNLIQGVDIWLNTPIKPLEACGTSGMKAAINGVLNFSVRDGWWDECYNGENGWAITAGENYNNDSLRDLADSTQIYDMLENEIIPLFYNRNENGIPEKWVKMMKNSIKTVFQSFNIERMLHNYIEYYYKPALENTLNIEKDNLKILKEISNIVSILKSNWIKIYIKDFFTSIDKIKILRSDDPITIEAYVYLDQIDEKLIDVELFIQIADLNEYNIIKLQFIERYQDNVAKYAGKFSFHYSGLQHFALRIVPANRYIRIIFPELIKWKD
ncbi:MAG: alpha-glucan family phosphorylase [Exilispira sp.]